MRVLVVEDYDPLRRSIAKVLAEEGYAVDEVGRGDDGLARALAIDYGVVVLDLNLPGMDGLSVLGELRAARRPCRVLILTARDALGDRVRGLDLGGDDYLVKPFAMEELLARLRALLRRGHGPAPSRLRVGHLEIDTESHEVLVAGEPVELTAREFALLEYLARRAGRVVSRAEILEHVYGGEVGGTSNIVDVYVGYLRRKIERFGRPELLRTKRGRGYLLQGESP